MPYGRVSTTEESAAKRAQQPDSAEQEHRPPSHPLVSLQSHVGNRQVARMLAQRQEGLEDEEEVQAKHDAALAQRASEGVEDEDELQMKRDPALAQRAPEEDELAMKRDPAPVVGLAGGPIPDDVSRSIDASRGTGSGLSPAIQTKMEGALGTDFSGVKVHHDDQSDSLARGLTAKAFTTGSDIFLRRDQSPNDQGLLAHELTHVVQQSSGAGGGGAMTVGAAEHADEHEADAVAAAVGSGQAARKLEESHP
ncbi:MAG: DUF4157 domain-containing protein [Dehalococcoidia bacterium]